MRRARVLVARTASQQSKGPRTAPEEFWMRAVRPGVSSVLATHDVIAGRQQPHHGVERREPRAEGESMATTFECRDVALECLARRIPRAGILVALVAPEPVLHVRRGLIDGLHHGAAEGIT